MTILFEKHSNQCCCTYCSVSWRKPSPQLHYGLNIPTDKSWNSWWVIKYLPGCYIRITFPWIRRFNDKVAKNEN